MSDTSKQFQDIVAGLDMGKAEQAAVEEHHARRRMLHNEVHTHDVHLHGLLHLLRETDSREQPKRHMAITADILGGSEYMNDLLGAMDPLGKSNHNSCPSCDKPLHSARCAAGDCNGAHGYVSDEYPED